MPPGWLSGRESGWETGAEWKTWQLGNGLDPEEGKEALDRKRAKGWLTLCLNSDFSSRVMVSALAMTGMMFTTLLRCFMNSRSRGRKLEPRGGRNVRDTNSATALPTASLGEHRSGDLAEATQLQPLLWHMSTASAPAACPQLYPQPIKPSAPFPSSVSM